MRHLQAPDIPSSGTVWSQKDALLLRPLHCSTSSCCLPPPQPSGILAQNFLQRFGLNSSLLTMALCYPNRHKQDKPQTVSTEVAETFRQNSCSWHPILLYKIIIIKSNKGMSSCLLRPTCLCHSFSSQPITPKSWLSYHPQEGTAIS